MSDEPTTEETGNDGGISRRRALRSGAVLAGAGAVGLAGLWYGAQPALAATIEDPTGWGSNDGSVSIETHDGTLDSIVVDPTVSVEWAGFSGNTDETIDAVVNVTANPGTESEETLTSAIDGSLTVTSTTSSGGQALDFGDGGVDVLAGASGISSETFSASDPAAGETQGSNTTPLSVEVVVSSSYESVSDANDSATVDIEVINVAGDVTVIEGGFDTSIGSDQEVNDTAI